MTELTDEYQALRYMVGAVATVRDVITATGPDATEFLQGQLSQDVAAMAVGDSAWSLLLQPQGKMDALLRVTRSGDTDWLLDLAAGWGEQVLTRLNRFKLRTDCSMDLREVKAVLLRGPEATDLDSEQALISAVVDWGGLPGRDLLGDDVAIPPEAVVCSPDALEAVRIEAGIAAMGSEIDESTIPAEANVVDGAVSFTKGCFTGQELVARIDSRGSNTPRRLRGLVFDSDSAAPELPAPVLGSAGDEVGRITSLAASPGYGASVALAYLGRAVDPGAEVTVGGQQARVHELPMLPSG